MCSLHRLDAAIYGHVRGSDAPAVQSGQMVKSLQTLAMAAGLGQHAYCLTPAAQLITVSSGGVVVRYVSWSV